jgi:hypothetical protein
MKRLSSLVALTVLIAACGTQQPAAPAAPAAPTATPHANLAQLMRGIPFPASNIIFDAQSTDPGAKPAEGAGGAGAGATSQYASVYGGWQAVENSALAISETANLLLIPGRKCENGKDVPLQNEDFQKWAQNLAAAGEAAYKAAQAKNLDQIVEVSGTVSDACAMCHEKYRDKENNADRCS